jgi:hypothetical protein
LCFYGTDRANYGTYAFYPPFWHPPPCFFVPQALFGRYLAPIPSIIINFTQAFLILLFFIVLKGPITAHAPFTHSLAPFSLLFVSQAPFNRYLASILSMIINFTHVFLILLFFIVLKGPITAHAPFTLPLAPFSLLFVPQGAI